MNRILSPSDQQDICSAMAGLIGPQARAEAGTLAAFYGVTRARIYDISKSVRPQRKKRTDTGRRKHDLMGTDALKFAAELVVNQNLAPELALMVMHENADKFGRVEINVATFRKYLREHGISRKQSRTNRSPHRAFEAEFPGQIFQFDISGVKERWVDIKTRAIHKVSVLEVSKNHASRRLDRVPLWKFTLVDDCSRKKFVRFVACPKPNTVHVVDFLREAFIRMGLPVMLYTDNDSAIVNKRTLRGARFLGEAYRASGGFELLRHMPGNPRATGKVERAHRIVEEYEKLIGIKIEFGNQPHIDALNRFADWIAARYNSRPHSVTGISPDVAFRAATNPFRRIDPAQFDAAFKARDLTCKVGRDVTITVDGVKYQLSRRDADPFNLMAETAQRLEVYWLDEEEFFACVTPAGEEYVVEKIRARADKALEYRSVPETKAERTRKELRRSQKERIKQIKESAAENTPTWSSADATTGAQASSPPESGGVARKGRGGVPAMNAKRSKNSDKRQVGRSSAAAPPAVRKGSALPVGPCLIEGGSASAHIRIPGLDTTVPESCSNVTEFPRPTDDGDRALLDELTHHVAPASLPAVRGASLPASFAGDCQLDLFDALDLLQREGLAPAVPGPELTDVKARLKEIFAGRETIGESELRAGLKKRMVA
jgi:hypothetical protein